MAVNDSDFYLIPSSTKVEPGKALFYDKIISGNDAVHERVPGNASHVFNLGAKEFSAYLDR